MKAFDWALIARISAERAHFQDAPLLHGDSFRLGGDVAPSVQVYFQRVAGRRIAPTAILGVHVEDFEREWRERLKRAKSRDLEGNPPFGRQAINVDGLSPRPWVAPTQPPPEDIAAMRRWFDRVFASVRRFPQSMPSLIDAIEHDNIDGAPLWCYMGHPVKVRGFVQWLRRTHGVNLGEHLLPTLEDRTEPFDVNVMLDDPPC
jgi:hypothetical protein